MPVFFLAHLHVSTALAHCHLCDVSSCKAPRAEAGLLTQWAMVGTSLGTHSGSLALCPHGVLWLSQQSGIQRSRLIPHWLRPRSTLPPSQGDPARSPVPGWRCLDCRSRTCGFSWTSLYMVLFWASFIWSLQSLPCNNGYLHALEKWNLIQVWNISKHL